MFINIILFFTPFFITVFCIEKRCAKRKSGRVATQALQDLIYDIN